MQSNPFDSFMDHAPVPIAILDERFRFLKVNQAMLEGHRMTREAHLGKTLAEVLPSLSALIQPLLAKVLATGESAKATITGELPAYFGSTHHCLAACFPAGQSQIAFMALEAAGRRTEEAPLEAAGRRTEEALQHSNQQLESALVDLERSVLINGMVHCLQVAMVGEELYRIVGRFAPRLFPRHSGALCVIDSSRNVIEETATWGGKSDCEPVFSPDACWALREGRAHLVSDPNSGLVCPHAAGDGQYPQICVPMMAQSGMLGFVHLQNRGHQSSGEAFTESELRLAQIMAEEIALSLANTGMREILRQQAFQDPLTGLYNRRFLQEALELELRRAKRKGLPVALIMLDVDGFKPFNDAYGHAAGDSLLRAVATFLRAGVRSNDILCRYGGDEFCIILPETSLENAITWAGKWRSYGRLLNVEWQGKLLGGPTVSMGVACYPPCSTSDELFSEADSALYSAKAAGRNQVKPNGSSSSSTRRTGTRR